MSALTLGSVVVEDRDGGGAVRQASYALQQKRALFIYRDTVENNGIHWPRKFVGNPGVFVVGKPSDIPRKLDKLENQQKEQTEKAMQLDLFTT